MRNPGIRRPGEPVAPIRRPAWRHRACTALRPGPANWVAGGGL